MIYSSKSRVIYKIQRCKRTSGINDNKRNNSIFLQVRKKIQSFKVEVDICLNSLTFIKMSGVSTQSDILVILTYIYFSGKNIFIIRLNICQTIWFVQILERLTSDKTTLKLKIYGQNPKIFININ